MNEKTEQLVRELAEKLGTTTTHLWEVLTRQAPISAASDVVVALLLIGVMWAAYQMVRRKTSVPPRSEENPYPEAIWEDEVAFIAWTILAVYGVFVLVTVCYTIGSVATALMNPEYWALKQ